MGIAGGTIETKTDPVLTVDADDPLPFPITAQLVQPGSGWPREFFYALYTIQLRQLYLRPTTRLLRDRPRSPPLKKFLGFFVLEAP